MRIGKIQIEVSKELFWRKLFFCVLGSLILAFGIYNIHSISPVTEGGAIGLNLLIEHLFFISPAVSNPVVSAIFYFIGWKYLGKKFLMYSGFSIIAFSIFYEIFALFPGVYPGISENIVLASVLGAVFVGLGVGINVLGGGASGADDALAMSLNKRFGFSMQKIYLISDVVVLTLSLVYIPFTKILFSLFSVILSGQIIEWIVKSKSLNAFVRK